ncbi:hypothetical protein AB0M23_00350 [Streptomyces sp. NPDC052077]|uniref:hypothetical protein n=1 Tax=Streptomyces sp. NPDC052077 TaxID=3154757 RepID=UPI00342BE67A
MEQRIESSSQPLNGAGSDPAFIPGLTAPGVSGAPEAARPGTAEVTGEDAAPGGPEAGAAEPDGGAAEPESEAVEGPAFEAADRRARIVADHRGVRLALDDQECEFRWDEIGAVETETARFGKRYTVTVHTPDRRWYPIEVEAPSRSRFKDWDAALDEVLDAYFEDGGADTDGEADGTAEGTADAAKDGGSGKTDASVTDKASDKESDKAGTSAEDGASGRTGDAAEK